MTISYNIAIIDFLIAIMVFGLYFKKRRWSGFLLFGLLTLSAALYSSMSSLIQAHLDEPENLHIFELFAFCGLNLMIVFLLHFTTALTDWKKRKLCIMGYVGGLTLCTMAICDFHIYQPAFRHYDLAFSELDLVTGTPDLGYHVFSILSVATVVYCLFSLRTAVAAGTVYLWPIFLGVLLMLLSGSYDLLWKQKFITKSIFPMFEFGFLGFIISLAVSAIMKYADESSQLDNLNNEFTSSEKELSELQESIFQQLTRSTINGTPMQDESHDNTEKVLSDNFADEKFTPTKFAALMKMSPVQLNRMLKKTTGKTTTEYIRSYRLKCAAEMLVTTSSSITTIVFETGFNSVSYFTKCFKKEFGKTPSDYRNSRRAGNR